MSHRLPTLYPKVEPWPGIQLYYPPVKYYPARNEYESVEDACVRLRERSLLSKPHTLLLDLEDGCRLKKESREVLRRELPRLNKGKTRIALRINPFLTEEYHHDLQLVADLAPFLDDVVLAKAGEAYGEAEIRDLSAFLAKVNPEIRIQPIIEHPKSLKIAHKLMNYDTVKHVVFGIHDFSKAMAFHISPEGWQEQLKPFMTELLLEARLLGRGVIGGVEVLINKEPLPENHVEPDDVRRWLDLRGDRESRIVYQHAVNEVAMGFTGKQVIHPNHVHLCRVAFVPSSTEIRRHKKILTLAMEADALLGGAIRFEDQMLDPPMFGKSLQTLLRAEALGALGEEDIAFVRQVMEKLPDQVIRENWPYGVIL
ncbi:MAG: aldolase/citrate lyase family protein [Leptospiraceae bacterium]|nr:aldolase/citrate lyase family protein [Leptospiraceae bacterium]MDW8307285.1 hypothetical protein [Leptospiraceae bacterium]